MADAQQQEKTFTQADIDALTAKHQEEMNTLAGKLRAEFKEKEKSAKEAAEKAAKQANMTELEKANAELAELQAKYQQSQDTIALANQKDETRKLMSELGVDKKCLDYVFVPKDMEATKTRIKEFKNYIDNVKKQTFENGLKSEIPGTSGQNKTDPFLAGLAKGLN